jgi:hypothetical protein
MNSKTPADLQNARQLRFRRGGAICLRTSETITP